MWNRIVCFLLGHDFVETSEYYGTLDNGSKTYKLSVGNCCRCHKPPATKRRACQK